MLASIEIDCTADKNVKDKKNKKEKSKKLFFLEKNIHSSNKHGTFFLIRLLK